MFGFLKLFLGSAANGRRGVAGKLLCFSVLWLLAANSASAQQPTPAAGSAMISAPQPAPTDVTGPATPTQTSVAPSSPQPPAGPVPASPAVTPPAAPIDGGSLPQATPAATPSPTPALPPIAVTIDLAKQRAYLLRGGVVELESPVSSGRTQHLTPTGDFSVLEKDLNHKSTLYGKFVKISNGNVVSRNAQSNMPAPAGARFEGAPMKFFIRFEGAAGTHAGSLPGYPASHGCVRMPAAKAEAFYNAVKVGTPVRVFGQAPVRKSDGDEKKKPKPPETAAASAKPAQAAPAKPSQATPAQSPAAKPKQAWWPFGKRKQAEKAPGN